MDTRRALTRTFGTFYDHGRRFVGVSAPRADELIAAHAVAELGDGVVTIKQAGQPDQVLPVNKHLHRRAILRWVADFNRRAAATN